MLPARSRRVVIPRCPQVSGIFNATVTCDASGSSALLHVARATGATLPIRNHDNFTAGSAASPTNSGELSMAVQKAVEASALDISEITVIDGPVNRHQTPPGFRHFLGTPKPSQRFKAYEIDPLDAPEQSHKVRGLMNRLSRRMDAELHWPAHADATIERWENPRIPSGYTYLLQFVAHDLVHSAIPLSVAGGLGAGTSNARRTALKLETLFGSGPVGSPSIYALDAPNDERRTKLRLGRMRWKDADVAEGCPFRDIARSSAENVTGIDRSIAGRRVALTEALVRWNNSTSRNPEELQMSIERLQVTNHERWGKLVKTWATGMNYLENDNEHPLPATMDEFKEQLAKAQVFANVPERFKSIKFVSSDQETILLRLQ